MTIAEIIYQVGFTTPDYFARSFKQKFDMLPSEYIAIQRKESPGEKNVLVSKTKTHRK